MIKKIVCKKIVSIYWPLLRLIKSLILATSSDLHIRVISSILAYSLLFKFIYIVCLYYALEIKKSFSFDVT